MTLTLAKNLGTDGDTQPVQIQAGRYLFAVGGVMGGATVSFKLNVGAAIGVPVAGMAYTTNVAEIAWLPDCTGFISVTGASGSTDITVALAPVSLDVT